MVTAEVQPGKHLYMGMVMMEKGLWSIFARHSAQMMMECMETEANTGLRCAWEKKQGGSGLRLEVEGLVG